MLKTQFLGKTLASPLVLASGIRGVTAAGLRHIVDSGAGAVTAKSVSLAARAGHNNPTMIGAEHWFLNAVGLSNPGIEEEIKELTKFKEICSAPLIGSIFGGAPDEFAAVTEKINSAPIDFLEVNVSCPNVTQEFGSPFAYSASAVEKITKKVKEKSRAPVIVKLSPNAWNIADIAVAAEAAGADAITAVNTVSGMAIDVRARFPILYNKQGGVSGPALFPIALKCVYDICKKVKIPVIGTGGVNSGEDALAMIMAGASLVGVGSAVYFRGEDAFTLIAGELEKIMREEGIKTLDEVRGAATKR